jgi:tetratricopeptide (TPR) repeat protein
MDEFVLFEDYIDGALSNKVAQDIRTKMGIDPEMADEISFRSEVNEALKDKNFFEFKGLIKNNLDAKSTGSKLMLHKDMLKTWHLAAASFALILVVGGLWYILSDKPYSTERLVSKYYKPAHPILQVRSVEINSDDALKEAFSFYQQNDFVNALKYFTSLDNQITAKFYSGVCYIELEQYERAITSFEFVINDKDNLFVEQAEWYLGLIYLMNNQKALAIDQFKKISGSESYYSSQAQEILKYLN